jgi:prolipoprotein diacylglyceryltransferase
MTWLGLLDSILSSWGLLQALALLVGGMALWRVEGRRGLVAFAVGCLGAALGTVLLGPALRLPAMLLSGAPLELEVMSFGALLGMVVGYGWWAGRAQVDGVAVALGPMVALARVGCFVAGCDYGRVTQVPWGVRRAPGQPAFIAQVERGLLPFDAAASLPVHPTQLYEALLGLVMLWVAWLARRRGVPALAPVLMSYGAGRLFIELWRGDLRAMFGPLSLAQLLSLVLLAGCVLWWVRDVKPDSRRRAGA